MGRRSRRRAIRKGLKRLVPGKRTRRKVKRKAIKEIKKARRGLKKAGKVVAKRGKRALSEWDQFRKMLIKEYGVKSMKAAGKMWKQFKKDNEEHFKSFGKYPQMTKDAISKLMEKVGIKI